MRWVDLLNTWEINNLGIIRNKYNKKELKYRLRSDGYVDVKLGYKRYLVHRLVAKAFIPNPGNKPQVNHIDGDKANYKVTNLEWVDQIQNMQHALKMGLFPNRKGVKNGRAKIDEQKVNYIKALLKTSLPMTVIAKMAQVTYHTVVNINRGLAWKDTKYTSET